jgi:hypothetical protein
MTLREIARPEWALHDDMAPLVHRVRSEFLEMPGLRLTPAQAARLWALDRSMSEQILNRLASSGFLARTAGGAYLRASMA